MRLRNLKNKEELINNSPYLIQDPYKYKGKWKDVFDNNNPIYIEIGMGFGKFITENAIKNPNINFIGIEKQDKVLARCLPKFDNNITNLKVLRLDALEIDKIFSKEVDRIFLNFSDPWPKNRHSDRRLSSEVFLKKYDNVFRDNKSIYMKTDNRDLYIYSLESFSSYGYTLSDINFDLHEEENPDIITTEYEDKFVNIGQPIYSVVATKSSRSSKEV